MCGINGILRLTDVAPGVDCRELRRTRDAMASRGPDGMGEWISPDGEIGLGHRRLAIIDLSPAGLQPMTSDDGRYWIVFNGEIYNYRQLREDLVRGGVSFRSQSDTEVLLALYAREGWRMLQRLRGMYAMALWDSHERRLMLARDPYGIKPLYLAEGDGFLRFASQVKALEAGGAISREADPAGVVGFLLWGSVPEPWTIRRSVRALPAGTFLLVEGGRVGAPRSHRFLASSGEGLDAAARGESLSQAFEDSVRAHLVADVPVAVFLSSGLDSSLIAALARRVLSEPPTTVTLQFDLFVRTPLDEAPLASEVARVLGTRHIERRVCRRDFQDLWPAALAAMDQPSIDGFNTYIISRAVHEMGFKVVLSGLGGDELLGGYDTFRDVPAWAAWSRRMRSLPGLGAAWPLLSAFLRSYKPKLSGFLHFGGSLPGAYFLRRGFFLPREIPSIIGQEVAREGLAAYDPVGDAGKVLPPGGVNGVKSSTGAWEAVHRMESTMYMRNQLLRDSDWASMANSLELRVPLVDARLQEAVATAGFEPALSRGKAEAVREVVPELPVALWRRPKTGFAIPITQWLDQEQGGIANWGEASRKLALRILENFGIPKLAYQNRPPSPLGGLPSVPTRRGLKR